MNSKLCRRCNVEKPVCDFRPDSRYRDGFGSWCSQCHKERNSEWAKENRKRLTKKAASWRSKNLEKARGINRRFKRKNKTKLAAENREWCKQNKGKRRATSARYNAQKRKATPPWADMAEIQRIYEEASRLQTVTGVRMHVDHIVPLQHHLVCGLHCPANLRIIPGQENETKKNRWSSSDPFDERRAYDQPDLFIATPEPKPMQESFDNQLTTVEQS